jgi:hypothetical protein
MRCSLGKKDGNDGHGAFRRVSLVSRLCILVVTQNRGKMPNNKSKILGLFIVGLLWVSFAHAQESVNATGGDAIGNGGSVAYSIGQVAYTSDKENSGSVAKGVQHAYEIYIVGVKNAELIVSLFAFPNPTDGYLTLQIENYNNQKLLYQLFDVQGVLFSSGEITAKQTQINMSHLLPATYFVCVLNQENKEVQSFRIIKN